MSSILALIGPTAVGKTDVSLELAKQLDAEIIGCDSMQVYRRMPHVTTQPTPEQQAAVPHHLISFVEPTESFNVGQYRTAAHAAIADIQQRGKSVLLVGGTGLYLKALTRGLSDVPAADARIRETLEHAARVQGAPQLHAQLQHVDARAAAKIHPNDARRIVRALEVYELTGKPLSSFWEWDQASSTIQMIGLNRAREELHARINQRVVAMMRNPHVLAEARAVSQLSLSPTARQVHGLRYLLARLEGTMKVEEAITLWQQQVRQYARRQLIWFRAEPRLRWFDIGPHESAQAVSERVLAYCATSRTRSDEHAL